MYQCDEGKGAKLLRMTDCITDFRRESGNSKGKFQLKPLEIFHGMITIRETDNVTIKSHTPVLSQFGTLPMVIFGPVEHQVSTAAVLQLLVVLHNSHFKGLL